MTTEIEARWRAYWEQHGIYKWDSQAPREQNYVIDTPPPTVSGSLHIGHVFSYSQADTVARYQRMSGMNVFFTVGFDDNGLPTERLVEKVKGVRASDMKREEFVALCFETVKGFEDEFRALFERAAYSYDWSQAYQTISPHSWKISQMSLLDLYEKGHLERTPQPTLWDPADRTAQAQAEVVEKETQGVMYRLPFRREDGAGAVEIATTRPELLAACVALLVHPDDPRAGELVGRTVLSPLFAVPVPIIADDKVDPEKGSGVVMCCTFGDLTDIEWWKTHKLPLRDIVGKDGRIYGLSRIGGPDWPTRDLESAHNTAQRIEGLNVRRAREAMVAALRDAGLVLGETSVTQMVPCADRSGAPLEILVSAQWNVKLLDKKAELIARARAMDWYPAYMEARFESWVENLKWDWGISRQRFFGVPLPFWYSRRAGEEGRVVLPHPDDLPVDPTKDLPRGYTAAEVEGDPDVLDTWATSSCTPQINAYGISPDKALDAGRYQRLFPADLRPQAHEIIRTWAFYTVAKSLLHTGQSPFSTMGISGWCLATDKQKMSKSKGNGIEPIELLDKWGTDVVRYWAANYRLGHDTAFSEDVLKIGKRLVTKLTNAAKFVAGQIATFDAGAGVPAWQDVDEGRIAHTTDLWLLSRLGQVVDVATGAFARLDYPDALEASERFFFGEFCDNYLELVKGRVYGEVGTAKDQLSARLTLGHALLAVLRLLAPFLPYTTEDVLHEIFPRTARRVVSIHARGQWPRSDQFPRDEAAVAAGAICVEALGQVRAAKSERGVSIKTPLSRVTVGLPAGQTLPADVAADLRHTVSAAEIATAEIVSADKPVAVVVEWPDAPAG